MKIITVIGCALIVQIINLEANAPDWRDAARDIERSTNCTPQDARDAARSWAKRNGYEY